MKQFTGLFVLLSACGSQEGFTDFTEPMPAPLAVLSGGPEAGADDGDEKKTISSSPLDATSPPAQEPQTLETIALSQDLIIAANQLSTQAALLAQRLTASSNHLAITIHEPDTHDDPAVSAPVAVLSDAPTAAAIARSALYTPKLLPANLEALWLHYNFLLSKLEGDSAMWKTRAACWQDVGIMRDTVAPAKAFLDYLKREATRGITADVDAASADGGTSADVQLQVTTLVLNYFYNIANGDMNAAFSEHDVRLKQLQELAFFKFILQNQSSIGDHKAFEGSWKKWDVLAFGVGVVIVVVGVGACFFESSCSTYIGSAVVPGVGVAAWPYIRQYGVQGVKWGLNWVESNTKEAKRAQAELLVKDIKFEGVNELLTVVVMPRLLFAQGIHFLIPDGGAN